MAFDASKFKGSTEERYMPVILLLDFSGSMRGEKINNLYEATVKMIKTFATESKKEISYKVAIITFFGHKNAMLHFPCTNEQPYVDATEDMANNLSGFEARGQTPLATALDMAKDLIEDPDYTKKKWYRPAVVLVSDGKPDTGWEKSFQNFISTGRTKRCQRLSMGIGSDAKFDMLRDFASDDVKNFSGTDKLCFKAENAADIAEVFELISVSIVATAKQNPKDFPVASAPTSPSRKTDEELSDNVPPNPPTISKRRIFYDDEDADSF